MGRVRVSIDGEFTGRIPCPYSMISLGAVAYDARDREIAAFKINIKELPHSLRHPETMSWWREHKEAWDACMVDAVEPRTAMLRFDAWLRELGEVEIMGWPLGVDFMFFTWYYETYLQKMPPWGWGSCLDIKSYAMRAFSLKWIGEVERSKLAKLLGLSAAEFSHDPLDDARRQAELFFAIEKMHRL